MSSKKGFYFLVLSLKMDFKKKKMHKHPVNFPFIQNY